MTLEEKHPVAYIVSPELIKASSLLPSNKQRSTVVHSLVNALGLLKPTFSESHILRVVKPRRATYRDLAVYHSRDYLEYVLRPRTEAASQQDRAEFGLEDDCPYFAGLPDYVELIAGATLTGVSVLQHGIADIAICWDGGRHHARKSNASGFCYVADCVLAILALKRPLPHLTTTRKPRVMYLDLDLHFCDAVSEAFAASTTSTSPQILTLSIHHTAPGFFPASSLAQLPSPSSSSFDPFTLSIPLLEGASSETFARIWPLVESVKDTFLPDFVVVQCGVDGLAGDPYAVFNWSLDGHGSLGWYVRNISRWKCKKLFLGGGGYNSANAARSWAHVSSILLEKPIPVDSPIPDHAPFPLYHPSFTLDVSAGNMPDRNSEEYLISVEQCYDHVIAVLHRRLEIQN